MSLFLLLLAIVGGVVVGDLVLENTSGGEVTAFDHTIAGFTEGQLLAVAAAIGFAVALLLAVSVSSTSARRARRASPHTTNRDLEDQVAELDRENLSLLRELADRDETIAYLEEHVRPVDLERWAEPLEKHVRPASLEHRAEPLEEHVRPTDLEHDRWAEPPEDRYTTVPPDAANLHPEPLYGQSKRAARLRNDPDLRPPRTGRRAR